MFWKREAVPPPDLSARGGLTKRQCQPKAGKSGGGIGNKGEELAVQFLKKKRLKIIGRSYRVKAGEIDIIAKDRETYCFIEVKSRSSDKFGTALEAVDWKKKKRITRAALWYLQSHRLTEHPCRFDVVAIQFTEDRQPPEIQWLQNAFELDGRYRY